MDGPLNGQREKGVRRAGSRRPGTVAAAAACLCTCLLAAGGAGAAVRTSSAAPLAATGPEIVTVGFAVANEPDASTAGPVQVDLSLSATATTATAAMNELSTDSAGARARLAAWGVSGGVVTESGAPSLQFTPSTVTFQAVAGMEATVASMQAAAALVDEMKVSTLSGLSAMWVSPAPEASAPPAGGSALKAAYAAAVLQAGASARAIAAAEGVALGPAMTVQEGSPTAGDACVTEVCDAGAPAAVGEPPPVGPDQVLVAVTVTYATARQAP